MPTIHELRVAQHPVELQIAHHLHRQDVCDGASRTNTHSMVKCTLATNIERVEEHIHSSSNSRVTEAMAFGSQHEQNPVAGKTCVLCDVDTSEYTFDILSSKQIKKETKEKKREEKKTQEKHI